VRESLFSALGSLLGPGLGGGAVLDAFAGSGALGLEAVSRGCERATLVELDRAALAALRDNVTALDLSSTVRVVEGDVLGAAVKRIPGGPFALLLLDPPYTLDQTEVARLLEAMVAAGSLQHEAVVTWEHAAGADMPWPEGFRVLQRRRYGSTEIDIAVREGSVGS
jgi:16S rRNA (guanine966-N2)-methyltransferase